MKQQSENPVIASIKGAVAGLIGTVAITLGLQYGPQLLQKANLLPASQPQPEEPTEKLAAKVAGKVLDTGLDIDTKKVAGQTICWVYGAGWGAIYGLAQNWLRLPHFLHGTLFGIIVGAVASTLVPALGLTPPPTKQPPALSGLQFFLHLLYGWITALVFHALSSKKKSLPFDMTK